MNGVSLHWFARLFEPQAVGDFGGALTRSLLLGLIVMVVTVVVSLSAGLAFRRRFIGANALFMLTIASLIIPSILVSLGIGLLFNLTRLDPAWHVRGIQPLRSRLGGSCDGPRRLPLAAVPSRRAANHRAERGRHRIVRLHALLRRIRSHAADRRQ
jgi:hypothetical protein